MKKLIKLVSLIFALLLVFAFAGCAQDGTNGKDGATWSMGVTAPNNSDGKDGDLYLDALTGDIYVKAEGAWVEMGNLKGPQGNTGIGGENGKSAYELTVEKGYTGTLDDWLTSLIGASGINGNDGKSAYELAVEKGYTGTFNEWLASLIGKDGTDGMSAYELAVAYGFEGTEGEWLISLIGKNGSNGKSAYELAVEKGYTGTLDEWLTSLIGAGEPGLSAFEIYKNYYDYEGTEKEWIDDLVNGRLIKASPSKGNIIAYHDEYQPLPADEQLERITHLNLCFIVPGPNATVPLPGGWCPWAANIKNFAYPHSNNIIKKAHDRGVKVIISLGGWFGTGTFPESVKPANRAAFVNNIMNLVNQYHFDGVDIDWEYPGLNDGEIRRNLTPAELEAEKKDFEDFMVLLKEQLGNKRLSFAVGAGWVFTPDFYSQKTLDTLDALHIMTYDTRQVHHADMAWAKEILDMWTPVSNTVISKEKVILGIPFYGRTNNSSGGASYSLYSAIIQNNPTVLSQTNTDGTRYYDGIPQVKEKTSYAYQRGAGGVMFWELGGDVAATSPYSLLNAIYEQTEALKGS